MQLPAMIRAGLIPFCSVATMASLMANLVATAEAVEVSGNVAAQWQGFQSEGQFENQDYQSNVSFSAEPELYWQWNEGNSSFLFKPYYRYDQKDIERSHGDIREMVWLKTQDNWELRIGLSKVFWGVTEFQHLVDVINQTDGADSFDGEEKLGQPMINYSLVNDWGIIDAFILPGFRERTFTGEDGRLRSNPKVSTNDASYQAEEENKHVDFALRWSHSIDVLDVGAYWFKGTNREPHLVLSNDNNQTKLIPYYDQITQLGIDIQATVDSWLWKFEALNRNSHDKIFNNSISAKQQYTAVQAGFEHTHYGILESNIDAGLLFEYGWDERKKKATSASQNDVYAGTRFTLNDTASSELLIGASYDMDYHSKSVLLEGSRRLGDSWKLALDLRIFNAAKKEDPLLAVRDDNRLQFTLERYF